MICAVIEEMIHAAARLHTFRAGSPAISENAEF
jgi:hypothetical protein